MGNDRDFYSVLVHGTADNMEDLFIMSICFSIDGKLLATGAGDGIIRVRSIVYTLHSCHNIRCFRIEMRAHHAGIFGATDLGYRQEASPQHVPGSHSRDLLSRVLVRWEVDCFWVGRPHNEDLGYY